MKRESARFAAAQQRPLHSAWPNPLQSLFSLYAARAISNLILRPHVLMVALEHHQRVLLCCAALAKGGGAASSDSWPFVLLHCLRVAKLYDPAHDPSDTSGDDNEVLNGGGLPYVALQSRLAGLQGSSLPETGAFLDLLKASLKLLARLATDVSRPVATFGHFLLDICRIALPLVPSACLSLCRAIAPLCFRPATFSNTPSASVLSPGANVPATPATKTASKQQPQRGLSVPPALTYASGLGRPALVAEDFPAALKFSPARVSVALRMRPLLPGLLEPLVLSFMELYGKSSSGHVRVQGEKERKFCVVLTLFFFFFFLTARTLDLVVTLIRCGVDYRRLDPKGILIASIQQQILGKRAYLKDPVRIMPSMYTFLGVLATEDGPVDGELLMQVAAPVFSSPYWRKLRCV